MGPQENGRGVSPSLTGLGCEPWSGALGEGQTSEKLVERPAWPYLGCPAHVMVIAECSAVPAHPTLSGTRHLQPLPSCCLGACQHPLLP